MLPSGFYSQPGSRSLGDLRLILPHGGKAQPSLNAGRCSTRAPILPLKQGYGTRRRGGGCGGRGGIRLTLTALPLTKRYISLLTSSARNESKLLWTVILD